MQYVAVFEWDEELGGSEDTLATSKTVNFSSDSDEDAIKQAAEEGKKITRKAKLVSLYSVLRKVPFTPIR